MVCLLLKYHYEKQKRCLHLFLFVSLLLLGARCWALVAGRSLLLLLLFFSVAFYIIYFSDWQAENPK
jgi:hypothetical protein